MRFFSIAVPLFWLLGRSSFVFSSPAGGAGANAPIRHWDASWAASCAQGTAIALACQDCVILVIRSASSNTWKPPLLTHEPQEHLGLRICPMDPRKVYFGPSWLSSENSLCAMTGLTSDVEHLCRSLQRQADDHITMYDQPLTTHVLQQRIASRMQKRASDGDRPFGLQALLVGCDDLDPTRPCLYSIDPSGSWQSWGRATAIGKYAKQVRAQLAKQEPPTTLDKALSQVMESWSQMCHEENINSKDDEYQVIVFWRDAETKRCRLATVEESVVREIQEKAAEALSN